MKHRAYGPCRLGCRAVGAWYIFVSETSRHPREPHFEVINHSIFAIQQSTQFCAAVCRLRSIACLGPRAGSRSDYSLETGDRTYASLGDLEQGGALSGSGSGGPQRGRAGAGNRPQVGELVQRS